MAGSSNDNPWAVLEPPAPPPPTWPAAATTRARPSHIAVDPHYMRLSPRNGIVTNIQLILRHQYTEGYVRVPELRLKHSCLREDSYDIVANIVVASRHRGKARSLWAYIDDVVCIELAPRLRKPGV